MCCRDRSSQQRGGSVFVDAGCSMDVMNTITFMGNTVAYESFGVWVRLSSSASTYVALIHFVCWDSAYRSVLSQYCTLQRHEHLSHYPPHAKRTAYLKYDALSLRMSECFPPLSHRGMPVLPGMSGMPGMYLFRFSSFPRSHSGKYCMSCMYCMCASTFAHRGEFHVLVCSPAHLSLRHHYMR